MEKRQICKVWRFLNHVKCSARSTIVFKSNYKTSLPWMTCYQVGFTLMYLPDYYQVRYRIYYWEGGVQQHALGVRGHAQTINLTPPPMSSEIVFLA